METDQGFVRVFCERCGMSGAKVARGWTLLCKRCNGEDENEWFDGEEKSNE